MTDSSNNIVEMPTKKKRRPKTSFLTQLRRAAPPTITAGAPLRNDLWTHNARTWAHKKGYVRKTGKLYHLTDAGAAILGGTAPKPRTGILRRAMNAVRNIFA